MIEYVLEAGLLALIVLTAVAVVRTRNLFAATILLGIYSLLMALSWTNMEAYDVAFTEAAVGAGISTILVIGALILIGGSKEKERDTGTHWPALITVFLVGCATFYGTLDLPRIGDPNAEVNRGIATWYTEHSYPDSDVPNVVTVVLASYRGYDTMFETSVIFTAGVGMILLLRPGPSREEAGA